MSFTWAAIRQEKGENMNYPGSAKRFLGTVIAKILRLSWFLGVFAGTALIGGGMQASAQEWEQVSAAAKREGRVIVSGPTGAIVRRVLTTEFQAKFPEIHVEFSGLRGSQAGPRILTELRSRYPPTFVIPEKARIKLWF